MPVDLHRLASAFGVKMTFTSHRARVLRQHAFGASVMATPIYVTFALVNQGLNGATTMAVLCALAAMCALAAIVVLRVSSHASLAGHLFTLSLAVQVFGEMALSGGLQAPAAALSLLVVPAAIVTAGSTAVRPWAVITVLSLSAICVMDFKNILPANELPPAAQLFDRMFSLAAGIVVAAAMILLFERQAVRAIDKLRHERADFRHRALHDALTGMPNRSQFYERAERLIETCKIELSGCAFFYFDIDQFKQINDQYGHSVGDSLLVEFAQRLASRARPVDLAARLAGDEFAMVVNAPVDTRAMDHLIRRLRTIPVEPYVLEGHTLSVGMSIGYAVFPQDGDDLGTLLKVADSRMYTDKTARRTTVLASQTDNVVSLSERGAGDTTFGDQTRAGQKG